MEVSTKAIRFRGSSLADLRAFPIAAKREAGFQLDRVQHGLEPSDWKPMPSIGVGCREIRVRDADGAFRIVYIAKFEAAVFVIHCFQKKMQKTSQQDIALATKRYQELLKEIGK